VLSLRVRALESLLVEKKLVASDAVDRIVSAYEEDIGPHNGAKVVARAWLDPAYKQRLLADGTAAIEELGFGGVDLKVVENRPGVHNMVVCTLCSCYPHALIGLPPVWYKSFEYRSRAVREPRVVLREFGLDLPESVEIRIWDSSAELRYLVLPERPAGTEGLSEGELAGLVSRDSMIGVAVARPPAPAAR
ncbi:MAG TPA: nitrile hydratase subunit alpha, partial [Methylomirabilota bacterium]|nr:nitrile hydratase subunit alpha [Methylomirabilota bacterium]